MKYKFFNAKIVQKHFTTEMAVNKMACWFSPKRTFSPLYRVCYAEYTVWGLRIVFTKLDFTRSNFLTKSAINFV